MNKQELAEAIAKKADISSKKAYEFIGVFTDTITEELIKGKNVQLIGFGTFETRERAARTGHNPQTGETIQIPASVTAAFKPGKALKAAVNK